MEHASRSDVHAAIADVEDARDALLRREIGRGVTWTGDTEHVGRNPGAGGFSPVDQRQLLALLVAQMEVSDLPRAVIAYPKNARNFYHFAGETLAMVHRTLCHGLGVCRYWGETAADGPRVGSYSAGSEKVPEAS